MKQYLLEVHQSKQRLNVAFTDWMINDYRGSEGQRLHSFAPQVPKQVGVCIELESSFVL